MLGSEDVRLLEKSLSFFEKLKPDEKELVVGSGVSLKYKRGKKVLSDDDCLGLIVIKKGILRIYMLSDEGREVTLFRLYDGDVCVLSDSCTMQNITFDVYIDAEEDCDVILIKSYIFERLSKQNTYVELFSYKLTTERFSQVMWTIEQILFMSFDKRLAVFLWDEASKNKSTILSLTHEQVAKYMGSAREVVSRMLKYFENEGIVKLSRGSIEIIDKHKLKSYIY